MPILTLLSLIGALVKIAIEIIELLREHGAMGAVPEAAQQLASIDQHARALQASVERTRTFWDQRAADVQGP